MVQDPAKAGTPPAAPGQAVTPPAAPATPPPAPPPASPPASPPPPAAPPAAAAAAAPPQGGQPPAAPAGQPPAAGAPPADPSAQTPPPGALAAPEALSDEQILLALQDPRAQALISYATDEGQPAAPASAQPPAAPAAASAAGANGDFLGQMATLAKEGDTDGMQAAVVAEQLRVRTTSDAAAAAKVTQDTTRQQLLGGLAKAPELQNLNAAEQIRLVTALKQGDVPFVAEASKIIGERQAAAVQAGTVAAGAQAATHGAAAAAAQVSPPPALPGGAPAGGAPPLPTGDEQKTTSGYDVLNQYFGWEDQREQLTPPLQ